MFRLYSKILNLWVGSFPIPAGKKELANFRPNVGFFSSRLNIKRTRLDSMGSFTQGETEKLHSFYTCRSRIPALMINHSY